MATKYVRATGGNWNDDTTWALTSGGTETTTKPTNVEDAVFDINSGNVLVNAAQANCKNLTMTADYAGVLTHTAWSIVPYGNVTLKAGCYAASAGSGLVIQASCTLITAGNPLYILYLAAATVLGDNLTFIADKRCAIENRGNFLNLNGKTISGNSATNRLLIYSNTIGTPRTVTVNGGSFANCDFQDIAFSNGGADLDLSAITGGSGNCGGNSMSGGGTLTFTAPSTQTFATTSGSWSDVAKWTSRVPLPQDLARFQPMSAGQTITVDMPRLPDTDFSGCGASNLPAVNLTTAGLTYAVYGSYNLTGVGTYTRDKALTFASRNNASVTNNGKSASAATTIAMPGATLTMNDAFTSTSSVSLANGTLNSAYSFTCTTFASSAGTTLTCTGSPLWTLTGSGAAWNVAGIVNGLPNIALTYTGATATTFNGGTNTYNDIQIAPGSGVLTFSGAFTFHDMVMSSAGTRSVVFTKAVTYTQTGTQFLSGTLNNLITITSSGAGEPFTLSKASGLIASNYLAIKDSIATGGAVWLAGYNSTNISGNTGWHFNSPASGAGVIEFVGAATAKALCRGIPAAAEIVFTAAATAKALCRAAGSGVIEFVGTCSAIVAAWKTTGLFKATERYIGQYFKASKRRNN